MSAHHVVPIKTYLGIFAALMVLLFLTVGVAQFDLGSANLAIAMLVAIVKATLIVLYFMHAKYGSRLVWVFASASFLFLFIMIAITFGDYLSRPWLGTTPMSGGSY
jgi:cytochrome c oxidase subunit IV